MDRGNYIVQIAAYFSPVKVTMLEIQCKQQVKNIHDDWEKRRLAIVNRLNKLISSGGM